MSCGLWQHQAPWPARRQLCLSMPCWRAPGRWQALPTACGEAGLATPVAVPGTVALLLDAGFADGVGQVGDGPLPEDAQRWKRHPQHLPAVMLVSLAHSPCTTRFGSTAKGLAERMPDYSSI